jgi:hypothetical protein
MAKAPRWWSPRFRGFNARGLLKVHRRPVFRREGGGPRAAPLKSVNKTSGRGEARSQIR